MSQAYADEPVQGRSGSEVELRVPAQVDQLFIVRSVAAAIATQNNFDLDTIADLRLAVDEATTRLIRAARPETILTCRFRALGRQIEYSGSVPSWAEDTVEVSEHGFGWHVLRTLTDEVAVRRVADPDDSARSILSIEFSLRTGGASM
ncbi:ATP-binding protein [Rhodococcus sp. UNC363MFTsu5.1]|uniref:ATP-binding protein n=1 Tax=Rhodococcus sp. UNC363MFTsu5.1 TaxID=1449069 RepID=UPI000488C658|nr:ATP-binding protein [Rhodococcus sp. UNC363MFTsu5.1]